MDAPGATGGNGSVHLRLRRPPAVSRAAAVAAPTAAFLLAAGLLGSVQGFVPRPMLLAERFLTGAGWVEAAVLAAWAAFVTRRMLDPRRQPAWRLRIWTLFTVVFFTQLLLGLAGATDFLMSGRLHLPVPALILAGPIYRGEGFFMPVLFAVTVVLVGPAWCSHLCYVGAWDNLAAQARKRPVPAGPRRPIVQAGIAAAVIAVAALLRAVGAPPEVAVGLAAGFGIAGVGVMVFLSRRAGRMVHCTAWCPIGVVATTLGRVSPFRMRLAPGCNDCRACAPACRYDALRPEHIARGRPGPSCTLCGDCVRSCTKGFMEYRLPGVGPEASRAAFLALVCALHAVFLGVARL